KREMVLFVEVLVDSSKICVIERRCADIRNEVVRGARLRGVRRRPAPKQCLGNRIGHRGAFGIGRDSSRAYCGSHLADAFARSQEDRFILSNGRAKRGAVLIAVKRGLLLRRVVWEEVWGM